MKKIAISIKVSTLVFAAGLSPWLLLCGEESGGEIVVSAPTDTEAVITGNLADGTPLASPQPVEKPSFQVESTQVKQMDVIEAPEMQGLPPVEGTITITVHTVADPALPEPVPSPLPLAVNSQHSQEQVAQHNATYPQTQLVFLSATVYDHRRTLLRCYPNGDVSKEIKAWSNLDFNHFSGFGTFDAQNAQGDVRRYALLMTIGNEDTTRRRAALAARGLEYEEPNIPAIPDATPAFVILTENPTPAALTLVEDLHVLYRSEGVRMADAYAARTRANEERKAYLLANPPQPKDATIHFWKRDNTGIQANSAEGGQP